MTTLLNWSSHGGQDEDKTLLQRSQCCHKGEFWYVIISAWQWSLRCGQNLCGPFFESYTAESCAWVMADNGETKGLITPPPRWVSAQLLLVVSMHDSDHEPQGVVRIFVDLWGYLHYITLHYTAQFFPYQECNYTAQFFYTRGVMSPRGFRNNRHYGRYESLSHTSLEK